MRKYLFLLFFISNQLLADWVVDESNSQISFLSTKQTHITEVHSIPKFSGNLGQDGHFNLTLDLASVETGIDIRNERMREWLFDLSNHRYATLEGKLASAVHNTDNQPVEFEGTLILNGEQQRVDGVVTLIKTDDELLVASLSQPLIILTNKFKLTNGVEKLREIAGLKSISYAVPVTATLVMTKE